MFKKIPKTKKGMAILFVMLLLAGGIFGFFMGSAEFIPLPIVAQFLGVCFIVTAIYILSANVLKEMIYTVCPTEREVSEEEISLCGRRARYDFIVAQNKGYRELVLCRVGLDEVKEAVEINKLNRGKYRAEDKVRKRYNYDTQLAPSRQIRVRVNDDIILFLTYDEELLKLLNKR